MYLLRPFLSQYTDVSDAEWKIICQSFEFQEFSRMDVIVEEGAVCRYFYLLESGLIRFYHNIDGDDITRTFAIGPYCFTAKTSFRTQLPSNEGIQALAVTRVWRTTFLQYQQLEALPCWNRFIRRILNEVQEFSETQLLQARTQTAEIRYQSLLRQYPPHLLNQIPLKHLASFLGIAPQSLSRIRRKDG